MSLAQPDQMHRGGEPSTTQPRRRGLPVLLHGSDRRSIETVDSVGQGLIQVPGATNLGFSHLRKGATVLAQGGSDCPMPSNAEGGPLPTTSTPGWNGLPPGSCKPGMPIRSPEGGFSLPESPPPLASSAPEPLGRVKKNRLEFLTQAPVSKAPWPGPACVWRPHAT